MAGVYETCIEFTYSKKCRRIFGIEEKLASQEEHFSSEVACQKVEPPNVGQFSLKCVILTETELYVMCCRLACTSIMFLSRDNDIICNTMTSGVNVGLSTQGTAYGVFFCRNGRSPKLEVLCCERIYMSPFSHSHTMRATLALKPVTALKRKCPLSAHR